MKRGKNKNDKTDRYTFRLSDEDREMIYQLRESGFHVSRILRQAIRHWYKYTQGGKG